jgi:hypothetical protein
MRRSLAVLVAGATAVLSAAGCGGGEGSAARARTDSYVAQVNAAQGEFTRRFDALSQRIGVTITPAQGRRTLRAFEVAVDGTVARLRRVNPPPAVSTLHRRLVAEIAGYGDHIATARAAFGSADRQRMLAAQGRLVTDVERTSARVDRTIDAINARLTG